MYAFLSGKLSCDMMHKTWNLSRTPATNNCGWIAVSNEGLHVYSLGDDMIFDPISLTEEITPAEAVSANLWTA